MDQKIAKRIILECLTTGGDYAEIFLEDTVKNSIRRVGEQIEDINASHLYGAAIRILKENAEVYGYTNDVSEKGLLKLARSLRTAYHSKVVISDFDFVDCQTSKDTDFKILSKDIPNSKKLSYLETCTNTIAAYSPKIVQAIANFTDETQVVTVVNSKGVYKTDVRNHQRVGAIAIASDGKSMEQATNTYGGNFDISNFDTFDFVSFSKEIAEAAVETLSADEMVGGVYDVVIHNAFGGVIFHEACGHALEATSVAKGMSVFCGKMDQKIAADCVTAIDDGTIPNEWGSANMDDEGNPTKKNVLIENGILKSYMVDMRNGRRMNAEPTGSTRRQSYRFSPTSRMTNTYIANGPYTPEEIIANTKYGLFAKTMSGGSVNPATGEFNFSVGEAFMIEDGKLTKRVKGATLIGNGKDTIMNIDMVGNNQSFGYGMCGSSSGSIPACVGQPTIRVKQMTVGGNGGNK
ncbi:MAG: TldD/PmbA family protein [Roseburia sp.]|nr:TldD/PmbA family protein [Anaeroplasma bactoclasticum]MCM1196744.1 TldD/PmbA family protein [Roseburia sp.]MCM1557502.1 TldD/PmbA family protein [Anaeroplasma bactoclasticum]